MIIPDHDIPGHGDVFTVDIFQQVVLHEERAVLVHALDDRRVAFRVVETEFAAIALLQGDDLAACPDCHQTAAVEFGIRDETVVPDHQIMVVILIEDQTVHARRVIEFLFRGIPVIHVEVFARISGNVDRQSDRLILRIMSHDIVITAVIHFRIFGGEHLRVHAADIQQEGVDETACVIGDRVSAELLILPEQQAEVRVFGEGAEGEHAAVGNGAVLVIHIDRMSVHVDACRIAKIAACAVQRQVAGKLNYGGAIHRKRITVIDYDIRDRSHAERKINISVENGIGNRPAVERDVSAV